MRIDEPPKNGGGLNEKKANDYIVTTYASKYISSKQVAYSKCSGGRPNMVRQGIR